MILSSVKVMTQNDICATRHIQNNTICELVEVVIVEAGENVEKPENLCAAWIFSPSTQETTCRRGSVFRVDGLWKEIPRVVFEFFMWNLRIFLWKLWIGISATCLWKTLRKNKMRVDFFVFLCVFHRLRKMFSTIGFF